MPPRELLKKFRFRVVIPGFGNAGFQKCSAIKATLGEAEYWEGGAIVAEKSPSRIKFEDVTLERGVVSPIDTDIYNWFLQAGNAAAGNATPEPLYKRNIGILCLDRAGSVVLTWRLIDAWVKSFQPGEWDNTSDDVQIEQVVIAYKYASP